MKPFYYEILESQSPEVFGVTPWAHAAVTTDRALLWLASKEDARQKWRWRQGEQHEVLMHYIDQNVRLAGHRWANDNDVEIDHLL